MDEMKKYIIEFSEDPHTIRLMKIKNGDKFPTTEFKAVRPYTEPDTEKIRKEAFDEGYQEGMQLSIDDAKLKEAYQRGLNDAWECAKKIQDTGGNLNWWIHNTSASEVIEKIRQHEQEKEQSFTAEEVMRQYLDTFCKRRSCTDCPLCTPDFTCGRGYHFFIDNRVSDEEVRRAYATVLAKMKES